MKNQKTLLLLLLTVLVLLGCACLPRLAGRLLDAAGARSGFSAMPSVALDLSGTERRALTTGEKIALLRQSRSLLVTASEAAMTEAEATAAAGSALDLLAAAGLLQPFDVSVLSAQPRLYIDESDPDRYGIFWTVTLVSEAAGTSLSLELDDETGAVFSLSYNVPPAPGDPDTLWERNYSTMDTLASLYLRQLGLAPEGTALPALEYEELRGDVLCGLFRSADGEITVEFYVSSPGGFWTFFPE